MKNLTMRRNIFSSNLIFSASRRLHSIKISEGESFRACRFQDSTKCGAVGALVLDHWRIPLFGGPNGGPCGGLHIHVYSSKHAHHRNSSCKSYIQRAKTNNRSVGTDDYARAFQWDKKAMSKCVWIRRNRHIYTKQDVHDEDTHPTYQKMWPCMAVC